MSRHAYKKDDLPVLKSFQRRWEVSSRLPFESVAIAGQGPFRWGRMWSYLSGLGATVQKIEQVSEGEGGEYDVLVVGREEVDDQRLITFLQNNLGEELRVCSQEMLLAWALTGVDPNQRPNTAATFISGHPGLEEVQQLFDNEWPGTGVLSSTGNGSFDIDSKDVGPLSRLGYRVGKTGLSKTKRRRKLREAFQCPIDALKGVDTDEDRREWGKAESRQRLLKMAHSIAAFCRNSQRKDQDYSVAIDHWESDLTWLKKTYYQPLTNPFQWPMPVESQ